MVGPNPFNLSLIEAQIVAYAPAENGAGGVADLHVDSVTSLDGQAAALSSECEGRVITVVVPSSLVERVTNDLSEGRYSGGVKRFSSPEGDVYRLVE